MIKRSTKRNGSIRHLIALLLWDTLTPDRLAGKVDRSVKLGQCNRPYCQVLIFESIRKRRLQVGIEYPRLTKSSKEDRGLRAARQITFTRPREITSMKLLKQILSMLFGSGISLSEPPHHQSNPDHETDSSNLSSA